MGKIFPWANSRAKFVANTAVKPVAVVDRMLDARKRRPFFITFIYQIEGIVILCDISVTEA